MEILCKMGGSWQKMDKKMDKQLKKKAGKTCQDQVPVSFCKYRKLKKNYPYWTY